MNAPWPAAAFDHARAIEQIGARWDDDIVGQLSSYIAVPAKSPMFDPQWAQHGHIETVVRQAADWVWLIRAAGQSQQISVGW